MAVCGSLNLDLSLRCESLPIPGETITVQSMKEICGGKGANQAVAASRAGGQVQMIGRVGDDDRADHMLTNLGQHGIGCEGVSRTKGCTSGLAIVAVDASGQNAIYVVPGANQKFSQPDVSRHRESIETADVLLVQLEIPTSAVLAAIDVASNAGVRCILDPAPMASDWTDRLLQVDLICPNQHEAAQIAGMPVNNLDDAHAAAQRLHDRGAKHVAITMGGLGTVLWTAGAAHHVPATPVRAVDTTAAGDCFAGALAVRWAETDDLLESVRFANVAGAIAAMRHGAQPSLATRQEIETMRKAK